MPYLNPVSCLNCSHLVNEIHLNRDEISKLNEDATALLEFRCKAKWTTVFFYEVNTTAAKCSRYTLKLSKTRRTAAVPNRIVKMKNKIL